MFLSFLLTNFFLFSIFVNFLSVVRRTQEIVTNTESLFVGWRFVQRFNARIHTKHTKQQIEFGHSGLLSFGNNNNKKMIRFDDTITIK